MVHIFSCFGCQKWWEGAYCDAILCNPGYGTPTEDSLMCLCSQPYIGDHCEILTTENAYIYYNLKVARLGPIGALSLIPMITCFILCNHFAKRRHVRRIERALGGEQIRPDEGSSVIVDLLGSSKS